VKFFVDSNILVYSARPCPHQKACAGIVEAVAAGADGCLSTAVLEEVWHIETSGKAGPLTGLTRYAYSIFSPLLPVTDDAFRLAIALKVNNLGTNDRLHAGTCAAHGITVICTADAGFEGLPGLRRVDPLDEGALQPLLSS
jgi:uncharacterized protein